MRAALAITTLALVAVGCESFEGDPSDAGVDAPEVASDPLLPEPPSAAIEAPCGVEGGHLMTALRVMRFAGEDPPGVSEGLDLDGRVSDASDAESCGQPDFESPDGRPGIDNQFAALLPTLDSLGGDTIDETIENAINGGQLLLLFELTGLEEVEPDRCQGALRVYRAAGEPLIGTDGKVLPGQSFDIDLEQPWTEVAGASLHQGVLEAGPFPLEIPLQFFATKLTVRLDEVHVRFGLTPATGALEGPMGAKADLDKLVVTITEADPGFADLAGPLLEGLADLEPDAEGVCQAISMAFDIETVRAHLYADAARPE